MIAASASCDRAGAGFVLGEPGENVLRLEMDVEKPLWESGQEWRVIEEYRLGGQAFAEEQIFGNDLMSIVQGPDGRTYALEDQTKEVRVFDGEGRHVRTLGGRGDGPGEFRSPRALTFDSQSRLWVIDVRRYTVFDSSGSVVRTVPRSGTNMARYKHEAMFIEDNRLVDEIWSRGHVTPVIVDTLGTVIASIPLIRDPRPSQFVPYPADFDRRALWFREEPVWTLAADGTIWHTTSGAVELVQRSINGDTINVISSEHRVARFSRSKRSWVEAELGKLNISPDLWPVAPPMVQKIHVLDDGTILLLIATQAGSNGNLLDVLSPDGRYLGTIELDYRLSADGIMDSVGDTLLFVGIGELDIPYLVRARLERGG